MEKPGEVLFLSRDDINIVLNAKDCLERCIDTFRWVWEGKVDQVNPVNLSLHPNEETEPRYGFGALQAFPSIIHPLKVGGIKWLGVYRLNKERGLPSISAVDIINDIETSMPLAILDGTSITNMRTAGHAGVGAKYCARKDSKVISIIGCGNEGRTHLKVMNEIFQIDEVRVFDIVEKLRDEFKDEMSKELNLKIVSLDSAREAVKGADVICLVTTSANPVLMENWIEPGCHICATTGFRDLDPNCVLKFDKWTVGWYGRDLEWVEGSQTGKMGGLKVGQFTRKNIYADLATEIIDGKKLGRESSKERTVMTHLGMPALDTAVAALAYEKAKEKGLGTILKIF